MKIVIRNCSLYQRLHVQGVKLDNRFALASSCQHLEFDICQLSLAEVKSDAIPACTVLVSAFFSGNL